MVMTETSQVPPNGPRRFVVLEARSCGLREHGGVIERAEGVPDEEQAEDEAEVSHPIDQEGLRGGGTGAARSYQWPISR